MNAIQFSNALAVSHQGDGHGQNREPKACTNYWTQQGTYVFLGQIILPGGVGPEDRPHSLTLMSDWSVPLIHIEGMTQTLEINGAIIKNCSVDS